MPKVDKQIKEESMNKLREYLKPGDVVYTLYRHVSSSNMTHYLALFLAREGEIIEITGHVADVLEVYSTNNKHYALSVPGCGYNKADHIVHELGMALYPDGFECIGKNCPSNDHANGDRDYTPHQHSSGGYAFRQRNL